MELQPFNIDYKELYLRAIDKANGIPMKDRAFLGNSFENCFTGKEAVDWLCDTKNTKGVVERDEVVVAGSSSGDVGGDVGGDGADSGGLSREQAVVLVKRLVSKGIIKHVTGRKNFSDSFQLFQIVEVLPEIKPTCPSAKSSELTYEELFDLHQQMFQDPLFQRKKTNFMKVMRNAVKAPEIADWMIAKYNVSRKKAVSAASSLLKSNFLISVCGQGQKEFLDNDSYLYTVIELDYMHTIREAEEEKNPHLSLAKSSVPYIPPKLQDLVHLKSIDLSQNMISCVCHNVALLPLIEELSFAKNIITSIVPEISRLNRLKRLDLSDNLLSSLPDSIGDITSLEILIVDSNVLKSLPPKFAQLTSLQLLSLNNNRFSEVPDPISHMTNLRRLFLNGNSEIKVLPANLVQLTNLQELKLEDLKIEALPVWLASLPALNSIVLKNNNYLHCPPKSVVSLGINGVLSYLRDTMEGTVPCYVGKMLVLGMENMGKTSLFQALSKEPRGLFSFLSPKSKHQNNRAQIQTLSTDGIDIGALQLNKYVKNVSSDNNAPVIKQKGLFGNTKIVEALSLSCWDFAGQDVYYTTHEFFLSDNALYTVVWDITKAPEDCRVDFWLKSICARAPRAPIMLVATHIDRLESRQVAPTIEKLRQKYQQAYPQVRMVVGVSTQTMTGIKEFKRDMRALAMEQPFINQRIPGKYYALAQAVAVQAKQRNPPVVSWQEYKEIADLVSITDEKQLERATRTLHDIGVLLHYPEEATKDVVFLAPQWLSDCFSSIVTTKQNFCKDGRLNLKDLVHIWKTDEFPEHLHSSLLRVLERFEVIFMPRIRRNRNGENSGGMAIVPALLPREKPLTVDEKWANFAIIVDGASNIPAEESCLKKQVVTLGRKFVFTFVTAAFFARLLVRLLHCGEPVEYWRYGILVKSTKSRSKDAAAALVQFDENAHVLNITVKGTDFKASAQLLTEVLDNVNTLVADWPKVRTQVLVPCTCCPSCHSNPYMFTLTDIENFVLASELGYITCPASGKMMCIDHLAPDISLAALKVNKIDPRELQGLELVGEGSFAQVYKGYYQGKIVAIKQLVFEQVDDSTTSSLSSSLTSSLSSSLTDSISSLSSSPPQSPSLQPESSSSSLGLGSQNSSRKLVTESSLQNMTEFRREVWLMSTLQHLNIVSMRGFCVEPYSIVMEYMDLGSLSHFLLKTDEILPVQTQLKLALDIAHGMKFLHSTTPPLVHRDLKSPNVLLQSTIEPPYITCKVSDFGLSRTSVSGFVSKVIDNPRWCAPEIILKKEYDEKADVYSFGIILWEIHTRQFPFDEYNIKWTSVLEDKISKEGLRPTIPNSCYAPYATLIEKCWNGAPNFRPNFDEIVDELEAMKNNLE